MSGTDKRSCWLLGKGLSLGALMGLVRTVYQFSTMLKNTQMTFELFKKRLMNWDLELQWK
jgi:hypothetical protein